MEEAKLQTLEQIRAFLDGTSEVSFRIPKDERNQFIERVFKRFGYAPNGRADKGVLLRFIERMTGLSRQQVTRLVSQYCKDGKLSKRPQRVAPTNGFSRHYTLADVALLAEWMYCMARCLAPLPRSSWSVRIKCLAMSDSSAWLASQFLIFITCAGALPIRPNGGIGARPIQGISPSGNAVRRAPIIRPATSVSIACIKAIRMA